MKPSIKFLFLAFIFSFSLNCGLGITTTGNPTKPTGEQGEVASQTPTDSDEDFNCDFCYKQNSSTELSETGRILTSLCQSSVSCDAVTELNCIEAAYKDADVLAALGINTNFYSNLESVQSAINSNKITPNSNILSICENYLNDLSCETFDNQTLGSQNKLESLENIIPASCISIF